MTETLSRPTNPKIASVFYEMGLIEQWGSGIGMMREECRARGIPEPEYNIVMDGIEVTFRLPEKKEEKIPDKATADLTERESKIFALISDGYVTTLTEMSLSTGISVKIIRNIIEKLIKRGLIHRIGGRKTGRWISTSK